MISPIRSTIWGITPSVGSSIISIRTFMVMQRAKATSCCWPPLSRPAGPSQMIANLADQGQHFIKRPRVRNGGGGDLDVFGDAQFGKNPVLLRHVCDSGPSPRIGGPSIERLAIQRDLAFDARQLSKDGLEQRRLAGAVASEKTGNLAGGNEKIDALQDVRLAVPAVQFFNGERVQDRPPEPRDWS